MVVLYLKFPCQRSKSRYDTKYLGIVELGSHASIVSIAIEHQNEIIHYQISVAGNHLTDPLDCVCEI